MSALHVLATQSIEAQAQQEGYRQAYTIKLSINKDIKLKKGKEKRKIGSTEGLYKYSEVGVLTITGFLSIK